ncbi:hypothetical protein CK203_037706 [Vitis vinifera]|uniref:Uncharacterized protein n=1 Tax=Vitis vinifera TaxID=29760 RepID=A0A438IH76_VITVI|nr:hypothetical protein CK203_037706 [Vitis vinifera]
MPLSQALRKLTKVGLLTTLAPKPLPQPIPPQVWFTWDDYEPEPIVVDESYEVDGMITDSYTSATFRLVLDTPPLQLTTVVRKQPPIVARPLENDATREETRREKDEILRAALEHLGFHLHLESFGIIYIPPGALSGH